VIAIGKDKYFFVGLAVALLGVLLLFAAVLTQAHVVFIEGSDYYGDPNESADAAYWGSFAVALVMALGIPLVVLAIRLMSKKDERPAQEQRQEEQEGFVVVSPTLKTT